MVFVREEPRTSKTEVRATVLPHEISQTGIFPGLRCF